MIKTLTDKQFITPTVSSTFTNGLETAEQTIKLNKEDPDSIEISVPVSPPPAASTPVHAPASPLASASANVTGMFSKLFGSKSSSSSASSASSSSSDGTNMETCGNTANVTCNGENLIVTVTLKTSDLLNQCGITHESILSIVGNQSHEQQQNPPNLHNAPQSDHAKKVIDYIKALSQPEAKKYIQTLTSDQLRLIKDTHTANLTPELKTAIDTAKNTASGAGAGAGAGDGAGDGAGAGAGAGAGDEAVVVNKDDDVDGAPAPAVLKDVSSVVDASSAPAKPPTPPTPALAPTSSLKENNLSFTNPLTTDPIQLDIAKSSTTNTHNLGTTNVPKSYVNTTTPFTYESTKPTIASVHANSGLVTGVAVGDCEINITQAATSEYAEGKFLKPVNIKVVDSSKASPILTPTPPPAPLLAPAKTAEETKYDELKTQYEAIEQTKAELQTKIVEITDKIKNITMSPEEQVNETKYDELSTKYDAISSEYIETDKLVKRIIFEINNIINPVMEM